MRMMVVGGLLLVGTIGVFGQGSVTFSNADGLPVVCLDGGRIPVGSTYQAELMFAPDGTPQEAFDAVAFRLGAAANFQPVPGFFSAGGRTIQTIARGDFALFQVRVWESAYGNSYMEVVARGEAGAGVGKSAIVRVDTADHIGGEAPVSLGPSLGQIVVWDACIPEPRATALGIVAGVMALLIYARRSRRS